VYPWLEGIFNPRGASPNNCVFNVKKKYVETKIIVSLLISK